MKAYKGFDKGLRCRGYQFKADEVNITKEANCVKNGFHCAENPLDCLSYYPNWDRSEYWIVDAGGDVHEDGSDTKISCTELKCVKKLSLNDFLVECISYIFNHPLRECGSHVIKDKGEAHKSTKFVIVRGKEPIAKGDLGTKLGFVKEYKTNRKVCEVGLYTVDGVNIKADTYYNISGEEVKGGDAE